MRETPIDIPATHKLLISRIVQTQQGHWLHEVQCESQHGGHLTHRVGLHVNTPEELQSYHATFAQAEQARGRPIANFEQVLHAYQAAHQATALKSKNVGREK